MGCWISVKDRFPNEGDLILGLLDLNKPHLEKILHLNGRPFYPQRVLCYRKLIQGKGLLFLDSNFYSYEPTHWMPLPEPPKAEPENTSVYI